MSNLHQNDTCHVITPSTKRTKFSSRLPTTMGVDFLFKKGWDEGMDPVLCSDCTPSSHNPVFFSDLAIIPAQLEVEATNVEDIVIHPGHSFFNLKTVCSKWLSLEMILGWRGQFKLGMMIIFVVKIIALTI